MWDGCSRREVYCEHMTTGSQLLSSLGHKRLWFQLRVADLAAREYQELGLSWACHCTTVRSLAACRWQGLGHLSRHQSFVEQLAVI